MHCNLIWKVKQGHSNHNLHPGCNIHQKTESNRKGIYLLCQLANVNLFEKWWKEKVKEWVDEGVHAGVIT